MNFFLSLSVRNLFLTKVVQIKTIAKGNVLIAQPALSDYNFNRTVILVVDHNEHGTIGFILNRPLNQELNYFVSEIRSNAVVYEGGPVETNNLYYLHNRPDLISNCEQISKDLYWSGDYEDVRKAINEGLIHSYQIRFYLGYSGWGENQLQDEVNDNAWIVVNNQVDIFKNWDNNLWRQQMQNLGGEHLIWLNTPADPNMN